MKKEQAICTYQTRLKIIGSEDKALSSCGVLFGKIERCLYADISSGKDPHKLKSIYLHEYKISARHFNALRMKVEGKFASIRALQSKHIGELTVQIAALDKKIQKLIGKKKAKQRHQKKRRLYRLQKKREHLEADYKNNKAPLCFGGKKLFHAQFQLEENGFASLKEWKEAWQAARSSEFFLLGSKEETAGNQSCTATINEDESLNLRVRLPDALASQFGKYLIISNLKFSYGHQQVLIALRDCALRRDLRLMKDLSHTQYGQAISYRFVHDEKGWRVFVSLSVPEVPIVTNRNLGVIGIDINPGHLAFVETDRFGNPIRTETIAFNLYGKTKSQSKAIIGDACAAAIAIAQQAKKPIVIEDLDFQKKKMELRENASTSKACMLSSFSYGEMISHLKSRAYRKGVEVCTVAPEYTSVIGRIKYAKRYGLTIHEAAALCIGRRFYGVFEKIPQSLEHIPDGRGAHVTLSPPDRKRERHVWASWRAISKKLRAALEVHFRAGKSRSSSSRKASSLRC